MDEVVEDFAPAFFACNGRRRCRVRAVNSVFGDPCRGTYKYLQLKFSCV